MAGAVAVSAAVLLGLMMTGALVPALWSIFVFPFQSYRRTSYNVTAYGVDRTWFPAQWRAESELAGFASKLIAETGVALPRVSVVVSLLVAVALLVLAVRRARHGSAGAASSDRPALRRIGVTASMAAASVPVFLNVTRSDLCHLGFVESTSFLAVIGLVLNAGVAPWSRWGRRATAVIVWSRRVAGVAAGLAVAVAAAFTVFCITRPHVRQDTDAYARRRHDTDQVAARTRPDDLIFVAPFGGWHYLFTGRRNATPYTAIFYDVYSTDQWPVAARAVFDRRPRLLVLNEKLFGHLTSTEPRLKDAYFRVGQSYVLDERRPGPAPPSGISFELVQRRGGKHERLAPVSFRTAVGSARLGVSLPGPGAGDARRDVAGSLDGDLLCIFDGADIYVGHVAPSRMRVDGEIFNDGRDVGVWTAVPLTTAAGHR